MRRGCLFILAGLTFSLFAGCATFEEKVTPIRTPEDYYWHTEAGEVVIACEILKSAEQSKAQFNVDLNKKGILPVKLIVKNKGKEGVEIDRSQIFGVLNDGSMFNAYALHQSIERVEQGEISRGAIKGAGKGAVVGAVAGAALGAVGGDSSDVGGMAGVGAVMGGFMGAAIGADSLACYIPEKLHYLSWEKRRIPPGYLVSGFIFLPKADYVQLKIGVLNLNKREFSEAVINLR